MTDIIAFAVASYLLRADDEDMARWQEEARKRGRSFVKHIHVRLDGPEPKPLKVKLVVPPLSTVKPDPKPKGKR